MTTQELILIENESKTVAEQVKNLKIIDQISYERAATIKVSLTSLRKKIKIFFDPMVEKSKASYDEIRNKRDVFLDPTVELEDELKIKLKSYERKKEQEAEEARRKAEEERQRKQAEEKAKAKEEAEVLGVDVSEVEVKEVEIEQPLPTIDKVVGLGLRRNWKARVIDKSKLPLEYLVPDMVALNAQARKLKKEFNVSGAEAYEE